MNTVCFESNSKSVPTNNNHLKTPFGLKGGRLISPVQAERGLGCGCICPGCKSPLVARKGVKQQPHFAHLSGEQCQTGYESAIHLKAKEVISDATYIHLPAYRKTFSETTPGHGQVSEYVNISSTAVNLFNVSLEERVGSYRPDIRAELHDGTELLIEIFFTHRTQEEKAAYYDDRNLIEIDLSRLTSECLLDEEQFKKTVLDAFNAKWLACNLYLSEEEGAQQRVLPRFYGRFKNELNL